MNNIDAQIWYHRKAQTIFYKLVFELSNFNDQKQSYDQLKNIGFIVTYT